MGWRWLREALKAGSKWWTLSFCMKTFFTRGGRGLDVTPWERGVFTQGALGCTRVGGGGGGKRPFQA